MYINISKINFKSPSIDIAKVDFAGGGSGPGPVKDDYMYFTASGPMTVVGYNYSEYYNLHGKYLQTSSDMINWTDWTSAKTVLRGTKLYVRGLDNYLRNSNNINEFFSIGSGTAACGGNIMSLCNFAEIITTKYCFAYIFKGCNITTPPKVPAKTLTDACYRGMFYNCAILTETPELPAMNLKTYCYKSMFQGCTALTKAAKLPATKLEIQCYNAMFQDCSALTATPDIIATELADACYGYMFYNCSSLNRINYRGAYNESYSLSWVLGVGSQGTFYNYAGVDIPVGSNGVPNGWHEARPI